MTEEEFFRKNYPDACWGDRPLSPYWDYFQSGVEFGERQSEKKIEKMRNCANCKNYNSNEGFCVLGSGYGYNCHLEKWELKE